MSKGLKKHGWLWTWRPPSLVGEGAWRLAGLAQPLFNGPLWLLAALATGTLPLLLASALGGAWHALVSTAALTVLALAAARRDNAWQGLITVGLAFGAHCLLAIFMSAHDPTLASRCFPDADAYWQKNLTWIRTGQDPEYELMNWVPAHVQLLLGMVVLGYLSLGALPIYQGIHEVDLMNFYVGRLVINSQEGLTALALGWHPWSVARGIGYTCLVFLVLRASFFRLVGRPMHHPLSWAWGVGLAFILLDGLIKLMTLDLVRNRLAANLL